MATSLAEARRQDPMEHQAPHRASPRVRLGMLTPSSNSVLEPLCAAMLANVPEVSVHFSRFRVTEISLSAGGLKQFGHSSMVAAAALLADARPDVICWNGTSSAWLGIEHDMELCNAIERETGIPATSSMLATFEAIAAACWRHVGLVTPYVAPVQEAIVATLEGRSLRVVAERHLGISENFSFSAVDEAIIAGMIRDVATAKPDVILVLCTNLRSAHIVDSLERETGVPIIDSLAAAVWGALGVAGFPQERIIGWGRLFARDIATV